jgi:hypothetical protein
MALLEACCALIVALFVVVRLRMEARRRPFLLRLGILVVAAWLGEETMIHAYGFYAYSPAWSVFIDEVPLMITLIWPVVIHSAFDLARCLLAERRQLVPLVGGAIVLADASLIEPIAVRSGLWHWTEPGLFEVPPIGILGWAFFAAVAMAVFERAERRGPLSTFIAIPAPVLLSHLFLLAAWWGGLRLVHGFIEPWPAVAAVWAAGAGLTALAWTRGWRARIPVALLFVRIPGAAFFFVLLAMHGSADTPLVAYALAFAPPYLALMGRSSAGRSVTRVNDRAAAASH